MEANTIEFTFFRKRSLAASALPYSVFVNGIFVGKLKNGKRIKASVPERNAYFIELDAPFGISGCIKHSEGKEYNITVITKGGLTQSAYQEICLKKADGSYEKLPSLNSLYGNKSWKDKNLSEAEKTILLCEEFVWMATDAIDECLYSNDIIEIVDALRRIGAQECCRILQDIVFNIFADIALPLDEGEESEIVMQKLEQACSLWWEAERSTEMYDEFRRAVAEYILQSEWLNR